jgi:hypothetical protein
MTYGRIARLIGFACLASICVTLWLGLDPQRYFYHTASQRDAWTVPWLPLTCVCAVMLVESLVVLAALDPRPAFPVWHRMALGAVALAAWGVPSVFVGSIHAPGFLIWHTLWVWLLVVVLTMATVSSLLLARVRRVTGRRPSEGRRAEA